MQDDTNVTAGNLSCNVTVGRGGEKEKCRKEHSVQSLKYVHRPRSISQVYETFIGGTVQYLLCSRFSSTGFVWLMSGNSDKNLTYKTNHGWLFITKSQLMYLGMWTQDWTRSSDNKRQTAALAIQKCHEMLMQHEVIMHVSP